MIEDMTLSQREWMAGRDGQKRGLHKVDEVIALQAKVDAIKNQIAKMQQVKLVAKGVSCSICGEVGHVTTECQAMSEHEQCNGLFYAEGSKRNNQSNPTNSNTYNPNNRWNHPNFRWRNDQNDQGDQNNFQTRSNQYQNRAPPQQSELEKMVTELISVNS